MAKEDNKDKATPPPTFFLYEIFWKWRGEVMSYFLRDRWWRATTTCNTFITQATDLLFLQNLSENFISFTLLVSTSMFVYGTSLVILLKYFGADLQRRNDKFQRTIFVNLHTAVLGPGRSFQCWIPVEQGSLKRFCSEKKERIERNKDALYSVLVIDHFLRVSKGSQHSNVSFLLTLASSKNSRPSSK